MHTADLCLRDYPQLVDQKEKKKDYLIYKRPKKKGDQKYKKLFYTTLKGRTFQDIDT